MPISQSFPVELDHRSLHSIRVKFLHTADHHIGMKFSNHPQVQAQLVEARFENLDRILRVASEQGCDYWIIAGDLFDRLTVGHSCIQRTIETLSRFEGKAVFVLPGNHDYDAGALDHLWKQCQIYAGEKVVFLRERKPVSLELFGDKGTLFPALCDAKHSGESAVKWILEMEPTVRSSYACPLIAVAHGSLDGVSFDKQGNYFPMKKEQLASVSEVNLWCLGHVHAPFPLQGTESRTYYSGTPEPDGWDCRHEGGGWIHQWDEGVKKFASRRVGLGQYRFFELQVELKGGLMGEEALLRHLASGGMDLSKASKLLLRLELTGSLSRTDFAKLVEWKNALAGRFFYCETRDESLRVEVSWEDIEARFAPDSFPYLLLEDLRSADDPKALQLAYEWLLESGSTFPSLSASTSGASER